MLKPTLLWLFYPRIPLKPVKPTKSLRYELILLHCYISKILTNVKNFPMSSCTNLNDVCVFFQMLTYIHTSTISRFFEHPHATLGAGSETRCWHLGSWRSNPQKLCLQRFGKRQKWGAINGPYKWPIKNTSWASKPMKITGRTFHLCTEMFMIFWNIDKMKKKWNYFNLFTTHVFNHCV